MRKTYRVNLRVMAALCEANYLRLQKLLQTVFESEADEAKSCQVMKPGAQGMIEMHDYGAALCLQVCEIAPFTTTLKMKISALVITESNQRLDFWGQAPVAENGSGLGDRFEISAYDFAAPMTLKLYHDLRMAEVTDYAKPGVGRSRNHYPNPDMLAVDERLQQNRLLEEWLSRALASGLSGIAIGAGQLAWSDPSDQANSVEPRRVMTEAASANEGSRHSKVAMQGLKFR